MPQSDRYFVEESVNRSQEVLADCEVVSAGQVLGKTLILSSWADRFPTEYEVIQPHVKESCVFLWGNRSRSLGIQIDVSFPTTDEVLEYKLMYQTCELGSRVRKLYPIPICLNQ